MTGKNRKKSMLWKAYRQNEDKNHYILGTMHSASAEAYTFAEIACKYIELCDVYSGEMDLNAAGQTDMLSYMYLPDNLSLNDYISEKKFEKYRRMIQKAFKIDLNNYRRFLPFYISTILSGQSLGQDMVQPLDYYLWQYAQDAGRDMRGLESPEDQLQILSQIPMDYQLHSLKSQIGNVRRYNQSNKMMSKRYAAGQLDNLYKSAKKDMGEIRQIMIYDRNQRMTDTIKQYFQEKSCFISVGAAHLAGDKGILAGLKRSGYQLKMVFE